MGKGSKTDSLPRGVTIRKRNSTFDCYQVAFTYKGIECREQVKIEVTPKNTKYVTNLLGEIQNKIHLQVFNYADYFPDSPKLKFFGQVVDRTKNVKDYMDEYIAACKKRGLSPSSINGYQKLVQALKYFHDFPVVELTPHVFKQFIIKSGNSPKTLRNKFSFLRTTLAEAVTDGIVTTNPVDSVKLSNYVKIENKVNIDGENVEVDPFKPKEVEAILEACAADEVNLVRFVFNTGLRPSEWSALRWGHIDFDNKEVIIKEAIVQSIEGSELKGPKSKAGKRTVPLNVEALGALQEQKTLSLLANGFVFPQDFTKPVQLPNGKLNRINPDSFRKHRWSAILERAGVRYRYPYQMRHTYATKHISQGIHIWQLAQWMGHSGPEMIYRHYGNYIEDYQKKEQIRTGIARTDELKNISE